MDGRVEGLVASQICDKTDQTLLTWKEIKDGYGSCSKFCRSMGLNPMNPQDLDELKEISRGMKKNST